MQRLIKLLSLLFLWSLTAFCKDATLYKMMDMRPDGKLRKEGYLQFNIQPVSTAKANAIMCSDDVRKVKKINLYMPDPHMRHGAAPPAYHEIAVPSMFEKYKKNRNNFGCLKITSMELFMPGLWQIQIIYNDGVRGVFDVKLDK